MSTRAYLWLVLALCAAVVVPALALNLTLAWNNHRFDKAALASAWQEKTRGVTYAPPISENRPFKTLRLHDRIHDINAVVFGSSTMMGIGAGALPESVHAYNFAQSGNPLIAVIGEAEYVLRRWRGSVRHLVIPLDWALGFVYAGAAPQAIDLSLEARPVPATIGFPLRAQMQDALSLPRIRDLMSIMRDVFRAADRTMAFRQFFLEPASAPYRCADGTLARDYDTIFRGKCVGFRYDGSATFADQKRIMADTAAVRLATAAASGSQYAIALRSAGGQPARELLDRLAALARIASEQGGHAIFLLPPLMPGLERALLASSHSGRALTRTKAALAEWAQREGITLLDAAASERYGCHATEFIDPHHALPECYKKIFGHLWSGHGLAGMQRADR